MSGGFRSLIAPVAKRLNIPLENIYANRMKFFDDGKYTFPQAALLIRFIFIFIFPDYIVNLYRK